MANKKANHFWIEPDELSRKGMDFCSLEAQGLWLKVMCLLHASERYGHLTRDGKPVSDEQAARRCGLDVQKWIALRDELLDFGLLKRTADDILFSPELTAQAEWRTKNAKRQKSFQDKKRKNTNTSNNGQYNGDITPDITPESRPNFKPLKPPSSSSSYEKEEEGGGQPPPAADSQEFCGQEDISKYLSRKQDEYPQFNVLEIYQDFADKCGSPKYPKLRNTWRAFDRWLAEEDVEFEPLDGGDGGYKNPATGKELK